MLRSYAVLDTAPDPALDRITALARLSFDAPMALVTLIDAERQWHKSRDGVDLCEIRRSDAFCDHALPLPRGSVMTVEDAALDPRFRDNPLVTGAPHVRFYVGAVLTSPEGANLGALCVLDTRPRPALTPVQELTLRALADLVVSELEVRRARRAEESKRRMLELAEAMSGVGHWRLDIESGAITWSDEVYRIHGVDPATFDPALDDALAFYEEADRAAVAGHVAAAVRDRSGFSFQLRLQRADGARREVLCKAAAELGPAGDVVSLVGVFQDVTEQQALLQQVRAEQERYRLLTDNSTDVIAAYGLNATFTYVSPAITRLTGRTPEELLGRPTFAVIHPDDHARVASEFRQLLQSGAPSARIEYRADDGRGGWVWVEAHPRPILDADGRVTGFHDVVRDISRRKELEARLESLRDAAEAGARAKTDFLANMSHELRTPLTGILGYADVLAAAPELGEDSRQHLERIRRSGETLLALVNDVMDLSKIEAGGLDLRLEPTDLRALLTGAVEGVWPQAAAKALAVRCELPNAPVQVLTDPGRLRQVVLNLLSNAVKFTDEGEVRLSLTAAPAGPGRTALTVAVADTGIGVPADQLARIFGRFEQADASITRRFGGTGLGLAISRAILDGMGGRLRATSEAGRGSVFELTLEAATAFVASPGSEAAESGAASRLAGRHVLLAEDVAFNRDLIALLLSRSGVRLTCAENGAEAVEAARREVFDAVLMDMQMPVMDGLEATRRIRASGGPNAATPVIALTANVLPTEVAACRAAGMNGHLSKPFTAESLTSALEALIPVGGPAAASAQGAARG